MKTAIKLVLINFVMQILGALVAAPVGMVYSYLTYGVLDAPETQTLTLCLSVLLCYLFMGVYLWRKGYLRNDGRLYFLLPASILLWCLLAGVSSIILADFVMSCLSFLPDWMRSSFAQLQSHWLGILCMAVLGPVLEELLFRGAITKVLLRRYKPLGAILLSGLLFGISHINPAQVVNASLVGILLAWLYYKTRSLWPGILIHVLNNSFSVWSGLHFPEAETLSQVVDNPLYYSLLACSVLVLLLSLKMLAGCPLLAGKEESLPETAPEEGGQPSPHIIPND